LNYVPIKITNKNYCARLLVYFHQISKQNLPPPWVDAAVQCYVSADNRRRNVRLRHSVSWCSSPQVLIYCHEHWTVN